MADAVALRSAVMLRLRRVFDSLASAVPLTLSLAIVLASSSALVPASISPVDALTGTESDFGLLLQLDDSAGPNASGV